MHSTPEQLKLNSKVKVIMSQTNYTREKALEKLNMPQFNLDASSVIREFMDSRQPIINTNTSKIISPNQEMFKLMRSHCNTAITDYEERTNTKL
jgi:hypothetical protein